MNLNPTSLLLSRSMDAFQGRVLFVHPDDHFPLTVSQQTSAEVFVWCHSKAVQDSLFSAGFPADRCQLSAIWQFDGEESFDKVVIVQPKAKELLDYLLAACLPRLKIGGELWLAGENKGGVKSSHKKLIPLLENVGKSDSARHCLLYTGRKEAPSAEFHFEDWVKRQTFPIAGKELILCSIPGVFGHGKVDTGTRLLLEQLSAHRFMAQSHQARILDFGCGDGVIALWLHLHTGAPVTALDDSALAITATQLTFQANGAHEQLTTLPSNGLSSLKGRFNYIVTNPPFHTGTGTDYGIADRLFADARQHLTANGEMFVVANDFLRYPPLLDSAFGKHTRLTREQGFAVYHVRQKKP